MRAWAACIIGTAGARQRSRHRELTDDPSDGRSRNRRVGLMVFAPTSWFVAVNSRLIESFHIGGSLVQQAWTHRVGELSSSINAIPAQHTSNDLFVHGIPFHLAFLEVRLDGHDDRHTLFEGTVDAATRDLAAADAIDPIPLVAGDL